MRKPAFCIYTKNKDADQLRGNREADQRLCFRYTESIIPLLPKSNFKSLALFSKVCVGPGRKPRKPVFSHHGSYITFLFLLLIIDCGYSLDLFPLSIS